MFTRECLAVEVDAALTSARVVGVLEHLVGARGAPAAITVDNGSEFYSRRKDAWAYQHGVRLIFSRPGKPMPFEVSNYLLGPRPSFKADQSQTIPGATYSTWREKLGERGGDEPI